MTNSMKQTVIKNPTWWKRRSALERGLTVVAVCAVLVAVTLAIGLVFVVTNIKKCETVHNVESANVEMLPSIAEALTETTGYKKPQVVQKLKEICLTPGCEQTKMSILENMDPTVEPCDDFYRFACGGFLKKTVIPDDKTSVNTFSIISDKLQKQLGDSIEEESKPDDPRPFKLLKTYYQNCMNKTRIEEQGLDPLHRILKDLGGWPVLLNESWMEDDWNWKESVYKLRRMGYSIDYFIDFSVSSDLKNSTKRIIDLDQAALGVSREYLSRGMSDKIVKAYYDYMVDIAEILGARRDYAAEQLKESLEFEIKLANISLPSEKRRNATALYNTMTVAELSGNFSMVNWTEYFNTLLAPSTSVTENEVVVVNVPSFIRELEKLLEHTPKRVLANYVMWRVAGSSVSYLNDEIRKRQLAYSTIVSGKTEREPRWKECVNSVSNGFSIGVGALYVRKYFNEDAKKSAVEMVSDIRAQFVKILHTIEWMDNKTKEAALDKAKSMTTHIAYPDELLDDKKLDDFYKKLEISPGSYLENALNLTLFGTEYAFEILRKPVNKSEWISHGRPAIVNAFYSSIENSIQFPAGILQGAFFSNDRPKYMNYGAIGFVMGHEITHGFDDQGRQFDKEGNLVEWWEEETKKKYLKKAECIIHQYGNYTASEVQLKLNGITTQGENIADNGGIKEAYLAYNEWVARNGPEPELPDLKYNGRQMFWISAANTWCSKYRPETLKLRITTGVHSPGEFRVLGPMSNMPEFAKDFNCPLGTKMNPKDKCSVW